MNGADQPVCAALIWCPFADEASARQIARQLVDEGLVACANIFPAITSVYRWQDKVEEGGEAATLFKTTDILLEAASARLVELHPYEVPAVIAWRADHAPSVTLEWLAEQTGQGNRQ